jgi:CheY-like chemotaxis protein
MSQPLRLLMVEDSEDDASLLLNALRGGGYEVAYDVVATPPAMRAALERQEWDVITSDHTMPRFSAPAALALVRELRPDLPFIIVSGEIDLNLVVSLMKGGAQDYIQKEELVRLVPAIARELREAEIRRDRQSAEDALQVSKSRYRRLFETAQDGILILDPGTGQIVDVNPKAPRSLLQLVERSPGHYWPGMYRLSLVTLPDTVCSPDPRRSPSMARGRRVPTVRRARGDSRPAAPRESVR